MAASLAERIVLMVAGIAVSLRVATFCYHYNPEKGVLADTSSYEQPALSLLQQGRFIESADYPRPFARVFNGAPSLGHRPMFIRTPGFPALIAAVYAVGGNRQAVIIVQILISALEIWFTYLLGKALFSEAAGVFGALVMAVDPIATWCAQVIMADTLFTTMLLGSVLLAILLFQKPGWLIAASSGTLLGLATLVRPVTYYLPLPLCVILWVTGVPKKLILGVLAPVLLLVGGWQLRNFATVGTAEFSGIQNINLLIYRAGSVVARQEHIPWQSAKEQLIRSIPAPTSLFGPELNRAYSEAAMKIIRAHPKYYLRDTLRGIEVMAVDPGRNYFALPTVPFRTGYRAFLLLLYGLAGFGMTALRRSAKPFLHVLMGLLVAYIVLVSAGADTLDRYRLPIMPFFSVYAGAGAVAAYGRFARSHVAKRLQIAAGM